MENSTSRGISIARACIVARGPAGFPRGQRHEIGTSHTHEAVHTRSVHTHARSRSHAQFIPSLSSLSVLSHIDRCTPVWGGVLGHATASSAPQTETTQRRRRWVCRNLIRMLGCEHTLRHRLLSTRLAASPLTDASSLTTAPRLRRRSFRLLAIQGQEVFVVDTTGLYAAILDSHDIQCIRLKPGYYRL